MDTSTKHSDPPGNSSLPEDDPAAIRKRILFISVVLGLMVGVTVYLIQRAITVGNPVLIVVVLPMFLTAIPMVRALIRLRKKTAR